MAPGFVSYPDGRMALASATARAYVKKVVFFAQYWDFFVKEEPDKKKQLPEASTQHFSYLPYFLEFLRNFSGFLKHFLEFIGIYIGISWNFPSSPPSTGFSKHKKTNLAREYSLS